MLQELIDLALFIIRLNAWALFLTYALFGVFMLLSSVGAIWEAFRLITRKAKREANQIL